MSTITDLWIFTRSETLSILNSLSDEQLLYKPEQEDFQPLYYQFACCLRTQMVFMRAIRERRMDFAWYADPSLPDKHSVQSKVELLAWAKKNKAEMIEALKTSDVVEWPDGTRSLDTHLATLIAHERVHHGQLISYFTLAGYELPEEFKQNWAL